MLDPGGPAFIFTSHSSYSIWVSLCCRKHRTSSLRSQNERVRTLIISLTVEDPVLTRRGTTRSALPRGANPIFHRLVRVSRPAGWCILGGPLLCSVHGVSRRR